jgi:iron complex outermembrane recepter protein
METSSRYEMLFARRRSPALAALTGAAAWLAMLGAPAPLLAQGQAVAVEKVGSEGLEEVVVTAQYRQEKLQDTPIAISVINADEIQQRSFTNSYEIGYTVPNVSLRPAQAAFGNAMTAFIRGVGQNDFDQAFEPGVGIYVDDVYQPFTLGTQLDLLDLDRVEVLRGPQGTLFGRGSIGGVIRMISKQPEGTDSGYAEFTTGSFNRVDVRAGYDFKLSDHIFARVAGVSKNSTGYQKVYDFACLYQVPANAPPGTVSTQAGYLPIRDPSLGRGCQTGTQGGIDTNGLRGQLRWVFNDAVEANFAIDYEKDNSEAKADTLIAIQYPLDLSGHVIPTSGYALWNTEYASHVPTPTANWGFGIPYDNRFIPKNIYSTYATYNDPATGLTFKPTSAMDKLGGSGTLDWKLTDKVKLTAIAAYTSLTSQLSTDADASPMNLQTAAGQQDFYWSTEELRLSGNSWDRVDWTAGLFFYQSAAENYETVSFPPILWGILRNIVGLPDFIAASVINGQGLGKAYSVNTRNIADSNSEAAYTNVNISLTEKAHLTLGLRYSKDKKDVAFDNTFVVAPINIDFHHTDWKAGLDYKLGSGVLLYGSAATGYRPPAYNPRPFTPDQAVAVGNEEMTAYELGVKADMLNNTLRTNVAIFYSDYNKRIVPIGGTECPPPVPGQPPVLPTDPGALVDSNGNYCYATTSLTSYKQLTGAKIKGAELEVAWRPVAALLINGSYGYTSWSSPDIDKCDFNQDGKPDPGITCSDRPTYVPKYNWSGSVSYDFAMGNGGKLTPRGDIYGQSEICSSIVSALSCTAAYELINLRLQWTSPKGEWLAAAGGTNVANKKYFLNTFDLTPFGQNTVEGQPGRPAEWYVQFTRNF